MQDSIERSIDIAAPLGRVWDLVTEPGWWVPSDVPVDPVRTPGHVAIRESAEWGRFPVEVVELRPMTYAAFRWASLFPGDDLAPGRSTLVEFTLDLVGDGVRVSVLESGFARLEATDELRTRGFRSNSDGWTAELTSFRNRAGS